MSEQDFKIEMAKVLARLSIGKDVVTQARSGVPYMSEALVDRFRNASEALSELASALEDHTAKGPGWPVEERGAK